jgi:hypothetical protein
VEGPRAEAEVATAAGVTVMSEPEFFRVLCGGGGAAARCPKIVRERRAFQGENPGSWQGERRGRKGGL